MSMWQFMSAVEGYAKVHNPEKRGALSDDDRDVLWEMVLERS